MSVQVPVISASGAKFVITMPDPIVEAKPPDQTGASIFTDQTPETLDTTDGATAHYELGVKFQSTVAGQITGMRFWKGARETTGSHVGALWSADGALLASATFQGETADGWQAQPFAQPVSIQPNVTYVATVSTSNAKYCVTDNGLKAKVSNGSLFTVVGSNGVFGPRGKFPTQSWNASNYFRDVLFVAGSSPPDPGLQPPGPPSNLEVEPQ
jgi:hypothetical protein